MFSYIPLPHAHTHTHTRTHTHTHTRTHAHTHTQVDQMLRGAPVDSNGNFDYGAFTRILKHGTKDEQ